MSNLRLVISGPPGSGRTTLAAVINDFCSLYGFNTEVTDTAGGDIPSLRAIADRAQMTTRLRQIAEKGGKLTIVTDQTPRTGVKVLESTDFEVGNRYRTTAGKLVKLVERKDRENGESTVLGDDGIWRYNREFDRGRVTGSPHDFSSPDNLIPLYASYKPGEFEAARLDLTLALRKIARLEAELAGKS